MAYQERGPVMTREKATRLALLTGILIASVTPQRAFAQIDKEKQTASAHARRAPILKSVPLGVLQKKSNVPGSWQQGMLLSPQAVSALDISADGRFVGITTLAFRHDRNFWVLSAEGKVLGARFVEPWAPFQVAVLPGGKAFGVGLAYSRFTDPSPPCRSCMENGTRKLHSWTSFGTWVGYAMARETGAPVGRAAWSAI